MLTKSLIITLLSLSFVLNIPSFSDAETVSDPVPGSEPQDAVSDLSGISSDDIMPDLNTGTMKHKVVMKIPAGINGMQPTLNLSYKSSNGNGWIGTGWDLPFGVIVPKTPEHSSTCPTGSLCKPVTIPTKYMLVDQNGNQELVSDDEENYSFKIIQEFRKIKKNGSYWEVTDTKGVKYFYGITTKLSDAQNIPIKWYLDKIIDPFGNYIRFNYDSSGNQISPSSIEYTGNEITGLPPQHKISFTSTTRNDSSTSYRYGVPEKLSRRLESISITSATTNLIRSYRFTYQPSPYRISVLKSIDEVAPNGTSLTVESFGYTQNANSFYEMDTLNFGDGTNIGSYFIADVNGDGKSDIIYVNPSTAQVYVALANGWLIDSPTLWKTGLGDGKRDKYRFEDVNGDGKADLVYLHADGEQQASTVCLSDGISSFGNCGSINAPTEGTGSNLRQFQLTDITGDGKKDIIHLNSTAAQVNVAENLSANNTISFGPYSTNQTFGNGDFNRYFYADFDGDGKADVAYLSKIGHDYWVGGYHYYYNDGIFNVSTSNNSSAVWSTIGFGNPWTYRIADFNGDGKSDVLFIEHYANLFTGLSTGKNFVGSDGSSQMFMDIRNYYLKDFAQNLKFYWGNIGSETTYANYVVGDFNGDGKADILWISSAGGLYVAQSDGVKFTTPSGESIWDTNPTAYYWYNLGDGNAERYRIGDFNGDGKSDILFIAANGTVTVLNSAGSFDNLLNHIENRQGGVIDVEYTSSTNYQNLLLPFAIPVVDAITINDGNPLKQELGVGSTSRYGFYYSSGYYSRSEKEFRGFGSVKVYEPPGPNGESKVTETLFHQGDSRDASVADNVTVADAFMRGKPYRIKTWDRYGSGYVEQVINYLDATLLPHFNPPSDITVSECLDANTCNSSKTSFRYDGYGNVTRKELQPDLDITTHNQTLIREFNPNTYSWIVSLPSNEILYAGVGTTLTQKAKTEYFYDAISSCQTALPTTTTIPAQNKVTGIRYWLEGEESPNIRMAYDAYGNKICERDTRLNTTSFIYDTLYKNYLKEIVRPNNKIPSTKFTYYGVDATGNGLYGQLKETKDANDNKTTIQYDMFGRTKRTDYSDQSWETITYNDHSSTVGIGVQNVRTDNSAGLWSINYFDGMNKTFKVESIGAEGNSVVNDTLFDARNKPYIYYDPYFKYLSYRWGKTKISRDYLGRVISSTKLRNPGSVTVKYCYGLKNIDILDENGHLKRKIMNGLGLVAEVDEFKGKYSDCSNISPTLYARTKYDYDILGHLTVVTDGKPQIPNVSNPNVTSITYDTLGRKKAISDPDMGAWSYTYYPNGLVKTSIDAKNQIITYDYDELNRVTRKHYQVGTDVVFTYDDPASSNSKGRLTKMTDASGQTVYDYDTMGRVTGKKMTILGNAYQKLAFGYLNGRLDSVTYPDGDSVTYVYTGSALKQVNGNGSSYVNYSNFDKLGRAGNAAYGVGAASSQYSFDTLTNRLASQTTVSPTQGLLIDKSYGYDDKGNITSIIDNLNTALPFNFQNETYAPVRAHAVSSTGSGRTFQYDPNGNITNDGIRSFIYNADNMPTTVNSTSFSYNGNGTRVRKVSGGKTTDYIDKYYECTNGTCSKFIFAGNIRVAINTNGVKLYYHPDHLGSSSIITNASGGKEERVAYYPFGSTRLDDGAIINLKHKYTGQELDSETGLYNYNARLYDPDLARFMTPDKLQSNYYNPQSLNRYSYVGNNPLNYTDPTGKSWFHVVTEVPGATIGWAFGGPNPYNAVAHQWNIDQADLNNFTDSAMATHATRSELQTSSDAMAASWNSFTSNVVNINTVSTANHTFADMISHWGTLWTKDVADSLALTALHVVVHDIALGLITAPIAIVESIATNIYAGLFGDNVQASYNLGLYASNFQVFTLIDAPQACFDTTTGNNTTTGNTTESDFTANDSTGGVLEGAGATE